MLRILKWVGLILIGVLLALGAAALIFSMFRFGGMPMMGRGFRGPFMFGRVEILGFWLLMLGRLIVPLALIALLVFAGITIGRGLGRPPAPVAKLTCRNCGRLVQADWNNCPYCGATLKNDEPSISQEGNTV